MGAELNAHIERYLEYSPTTGELKWKDIPNKATKVFIGKIAGHLNKQTGYRRITVLNKTLLEHRVCWFLEYKTWPSKVIDHINGIKNDNRKCNLRDVSSKENSLNTQYVHPSSPYFKIDMYRGVSLNKKENVWTACTCRIRNSNIYLGRWKSKLEAFSAVCGYEIACGLR